MGKYLIILVLGLAVTGGARLHQARQTSLETAERQVDYEEEVLAREIAKSAMNMALARAQEAGNQIDDALVAINGATRTGAPDYAGVTTAAYQGGRYKLHAFPIDGQRIRIQAQGYFGDGVHEIEETYRAQVLTVKEFSKINVRFLQSMAGYCSAVYLQRVLPDTAPADQPAPEMLFVSGHNRDGSTVTPPDILLRPGTQMNLFIGVDKDCSEEGKKVSTYNKSAYDWIHNALDGVTNPYEMKEGMYGMVEQSKADDQTWRIAFEDLESFSQAQHTDIKLNGYGTSWDGSTYGGTGWGRDTDGYRLLKDYGGIPDFSDQVIEVNLTPCWGTCLTDFGVTTVPSI